tara:strand:- start:65 stop:976 length:912 start_codon:yes stop_codon:yes gene_type:complete
MKESILILGGSGFIGKHFAKACVERNFNTYVLSLHETKKSKRLKEVKYFSADLRKLKEIKQNLSKNKFEYVVNLSGYIDHSSFYENGKETFDVHLLGLKNIISFLDIKYLKHFIQIGSSDQYGNNKAPQNENMAPDPISPYSLSKIFSENLLLFLYKNEAFPVTILRLFLVYGPEQKKDRLIPQLIIGCSQNKKFPTSSGIQLRDFCYVSDIVEGIFLSINNKEAKGEIINLGSGKPVKIKDLIFRIQKKIGGGLPNFGKIPLRNNENLKLYADIRKAKKILKWEQEVSLSEGIESTINFYIK